MFFLQNMSKVRSWCFTLNNYSEQEKDLLKAMKYKYLVLGYEVGENGTPHIQGYVQFKNARSLGGLKKIVDRAHWEQAKGTPQQAADYCKKDKNFEEFGEAPAGGGSRQDIHVVKEMVNSGKSLYDIWGVATSYQAMKMAQLGLSIKPLQRREPPTVIWIHGPTGVGKTKIAHDICFEEPDFWVSNAGTAEQWWDGYHGQPCALFDEFRAGTMKFATALRVFDRYQVRLPVKGSTVVWSPTLILVTSCSSPSEIYSKKTEEDIKQLERRITCVWHIGTQVTGNTSAVTCEKHGEYCGNRTKYLNIPQPEEPFVLEDMYN